MIRLLIVDDHHIVRLGVSTLVRTLGDVEVVGEASDGETALVKCRQLRPDVVLTDLKMPGMGGIAAIAAMRRECPDTRILAFTSATGDENVYRALECGALGYLTKDTSAAELGAAIREVAAGRRTLPADVVAALDRRLASDPLSAREIDVLKLVAAGRGNREIGEDLGLSEHTVKGYLKTIASKLNAPDRAAAVVIAIQRGLIDPDHVQQSGIS